ncbi:MAG: DUF2332 domain-containing protein [Rhizomicrobium sp.]
MDNPLDYWTFFADEARRVGAPLYGRLSLGIGSDESLREFANGARPGQPPANILFAAVHFLLLRGVQHPLREFYRNLGGTSSEDPFPVFCDFVEKYRAELIPLIATRATQTNEVGRSAILHAAFRRVAMEARGPLNLIEIGPSAGLNMIWDHYAVRYRSADDTIVLGDSELVIDCELRGDIRPPLGQAPNIASRIGLERNPVDLSDPDRRDWLKALVWPDQAERFARLEKAIAIFARHKQEIRAGDALENLSDAIARVPEDQPVCIYHTMAVYQFSDEMRETLDAILTVAGLRRTIWRLSFEGTLSGDNPLLLYSYRDGKKEKLTLGLAHPHGAWLEWLA